MEILRAATRDFDEVGFSSASISGIATHAGKSKSLVTYYFPTKSLLAAAILNQAYPDGVFMGVKRHAANPLDAILQAVEHVTSSVAHGSLARVALKLGHEPELLRQGSSENSNAWLTRIADYLDEARRAGLIFEETNVENESRFIVASIIGLITLAIQTSNFPFLVADSLTVTGQRIDMLTVIAAGHHAVPWHE
ncbi:hypothetical protein JF66_21840 [Cryobacterium sp. MLB-32]|uniref:TetR/AcrR family transcriptional regulator n=2 Tax=Cryobacterium sp. MLB-32 TaxID=1529318 RepID=UPI0004E70484|nr:TetR/AcrR family transcriptional regulator [Cryobacterium sp. MLB-32]KFF58008.1 hypothetical protein JF66_21840 [Cryobacterium sp. MLB-32]